MGFGSMKTQIVKQQTQLKMGVKKRKPGERYIITRREIQYEMEAQAEGRAKLIKRVTPYTHPNRRNGRSQVTGHEEVVKLSKKPPKKRNESSIKEPSFLRLKGSEGIYIAEKNREVAKSEWCPKRRCFVIHHKKQNP
jgi:hypothetical protein